MENSRIKIVSKKLSNRIKIVSKKLSNRIKDGIKEVKPIKSEKDQREQNYRIKGGFRQ